MLLLALGACSGSSEQTSQSDLGTKLRLTKPSWTPPVKPPADSERGLAATDFIGPDGQCAGQAAEVSHPASTVLNFQAGPEARPAPPAAAPGSGPSTVAQAGAGVTLNMSECEVVRAIGYTGQMEISTTERGDRSVVLTYLQGERPGIYRFVSGRLKSIERAPEPPAPPAAPKKPGKKPASS